MIWWTLAGWALFFVAATLAAYFRSMEAHASKSSAEARELVEDFVQVSDMTEGYLVGALQDRARRWLVGTGSE